VRPPIARRGGDRGSRGGCGLTSLCPGTTRVEVPCEYPYADPGAGYAPLFDSREQPPNTPRAR